MCRLMGMIIVVTAGLSLHIPRLQAQLIHQQVPLQTLGTSSYEGISTQWGLRGRGFAANFDGGGVLAPFGNVDPNAGLRTGIGFAGGGLSGGLGLSLNQGSSRSLSSTSASVTTMNGMPGSISSQTFRPFVTGIVPVVGGAPVVVTNPPSVPLGQQELAMQQQSQFQEIQARRQATQLARQKKAASMFRRGQSAEEQGNLRMARANYRNALRLAEEPLASEIRLRLSQRGW